MLMTRLARIRSSATLWLVLAVGAQIALNHSIPRLDTAKVKRAAAEHVRQLDPRLFRILSFGHLPFAIDWLWLKCLTEVHEPVEKQKGHSALFHRANLITELDPAFYEAHIGAGNLLAIVLNDSKGALILAEKAQRFTENVLPHLPADFALRFWQDPWMPYVFAGYLYLFEIGDIPKAAEAFKKGAAFPGAPIYLPKLKERLEQPAGEYDVGLRVLKTMINGTKDEKARARLEERRRSLFLAQYLFELDRSFREFLKQIPEYRNNPHIPPGKLQAYWSRFVRETRTPTQDPFGGRVLLSSEGRVTSTTPYERVFGIK